MENYENVDLCEYIKNRNKNGMIIDKESRTKQNTSVNVEYSRC